MKRAAGGAARILNMLPDQITYAVISLRCVFSGVTLKGFRVGMLRGWLVGSLGNVLYNFGKC